MREAYDEHESELGSWRTCGWAPGPGDPLCGLLERIWYFEGTTALLRERHFPDGRYTVIMQFETPHRPIEGESYDRAFPAICFGGMATGSQVIEAPPDRMCVMGIVLTPLGAYRVLGRPLAEVSGFTSDLVDLLGSSARAFEGRLRMQRGGHARIELARAWIAGRIARGPEPDAMVAWACARIDRGAAARIDVLRAERGLGKTRFTARFRAHVGVSPKRFASIVRVRSAIDALATGMRIADVAANAGYYDQAHFTTEMHRLAGMTPRAYLAALRYPDARSVAEPGPRAEEFPRPAAREPVRIGA